MHLRGSGDFTGTPTDEKLGVLPGKVGNTELRMFSDEAR